MEACEITEPENGFKLCCIRATLGSPDGPQLLLPFCSPDMGWYSQGYEAMTLLMMIIVIRSTDQNVSGHLTRIPNVGQELVGSYVVEQKHMCNFSYLQTCRSYRLAAELTVSRQLNQN